MADQLLLLKGPAALGGILHLASQLSPGELKSHVCHHLSERDTRETRDLLVDALPVVDSDTRRALAESLGKHADSDFVFQMVERFDRADDSRTKTHTLQVLRALRSRQAIDALNAILADPSVQASAPVIQVAAQVIAENATAPMVNTLTGRIDRSTDEKESAELADVVATIRTPAARSALIYAAKGNRDATRPPARIAAVRALANFPSAESMETLRRLQDDPDTEVRRVSREVANKMQGALGH